MGFLDKAKAAANDLASQAQSAMNSSGTTGGVNPDKLYRDLGQIVFNEHAGKPTPPGAKQQILDQLNQLDQQGRLAQAPTGPPPPPGAAAAGTPPPPPAPSYGAPPPPAPDTSSEPPESGPPPPPPPPPAPTGGVPPPPPPPGWPTS